MFTRSHPPRPAVAGFAAALLLAVVVPAVLPAPAHAQTPPAKADKPQKAARGERSPVARVRRAVESLNLQGEQKAKVQKVLEEAQANFKQMRKDAGKPADASPQDRADRREKLKAFEDKLVADVKADLQPSQVKAFEDEMAKAEPAHGKGKKPGNNK